MIIAQKSHSIKSIIGAMAIFITIGVVFLIVAITMFTIYHASSNYIETEATIVDIDYDGDDGSITIRYDDEYNKTYFETVSFYSSTFHIDDKITVSYNRSDPTKVRVKQMYVLLPAIFGGMGLIFSIIGVVVISQSNGNTRKIKTLKEKGQKKRAKIIGIKMNSYFQVNNQHPSQIICKLHYNGQDLILKSNYIWDHIYFEENTYVDVYIISEKKYYVDEKSITKMDENFDFIEY